MKRLVATLMITGALTVAAVGCNSGVKSVRDDRTPPPPVSQHALEDATPETPSLPPGAYEDGTKVSVASVVRFVTSDYAAPNGNTHAVKFKVTVYNGTSEAIDNSMVQVVCVVGGGSSESVFDDGIDNPGGHTLPGKSYSFEAACEAPRAAHELQVEVTPYNGGNDGASLFLESI